MFWKANIRIFSNNSLRFFVQLYNKTVYRFLCNNLNLTIMDTEGNVTIASSSYAPETSGTHAQTMISVKSPIRGDDSRIIAYVCTEEPYSILESIRMRMDLKGTIKTVQPGEGGFAFAVKKAASHLRSIPIPGSSPGIPTIV